MSEKVLHVVSFDVPYPPDYGGAMDVYYRIRALHRFGIKVILHCFEYGRGRPPELKDVCTIIHYYPRKRSWSFMLRKNPFIVESRRNTELLNRLKEDDYPILFEGLHTCVFLDHPSLNNRIKLVRTHNIEHEYYRSISVKSKGWRQFFFSWEAKKLKKFEEILAHATYILAIKPSEQVYFGQYSKSLLLPPSLPDFNFNLNPPAGNYALFHGSLSVPENKAALIYLLDKVILPAKLSERVIVAGKNPDTEVIQRLKLENIKLVSNPSDLEMDSIIRDARVHLFYSHQDTGVKLKLLHALMSGGWILTNSNMLSGSKLHALCFCADKSEDYIEEFKKRIEEQPDNGSAQTRLDFLNKEFNTLENCKLIVDLL